MSSSRPSISHKRSVTVLRDDADNKTVCGLTNHHVVAKKRGSIFENCPIGHFLSPDHPVCHNGQVEVVSPSHPDHERLFNLTTLHRNDLICQVVEMMHAHRKESRLFANAIKRLAEVLANWEVLAEGPNQHFGTVWATSGYRICDNTS
ncbi:hypothetical protein J3E72DRAFT_267439 [Bipolaris maydis]|nr:hypothetical protein BM1_00055 [Bipolaris maydis]KAJ6192038.1 hypothetical protein J3E72DRAFT_380310 [Bipolaris maydis]KAJ6200015.1 hypothetical protein J3E72DRAFT_267439 [Bipolaris maydis]